MLEQRVVGVGLGEGDLVGVGEVEVVEGEDDGGEVVGCGLEGRLDYGDLDGNYEDREQGCLRRDKDYQNGLASSLDAIQAQEEGRWIVLALMLSAVDL